MMHRYTSNLFLALIAVALFLTSCVSVKNETFHLDAGLVPDGHAVVFIAISNSFPDNTSNFYQLMISDGKTYYLKPEAINRVYVEVGWQQMVLENVVQEENNKNTRYDFKENEIHRFALIEKSMEIEDESKTSDNHEIVYRLVPTTRQAFEQLGIDRNLPLINHF